MFLRAFAVLVVVFVLTALWSTPAACAGNDPRLVDGTADLILLDGKVIAVDSADSIAEAVAIKDGRIIAVGKNADIKRLADEKTQVVHLGGKSVLPGLVDGHTHLEGIAAFHRMLDVHVPPLKGVDEILQEMPGVWQSHIPPPSYDTRKQSVKEVMENFTKMGVTSIYDFPSGDGMRIYQDLRDHGQLPLRLRYQIILTSTDKEFANFVINYGPRTGFGDDRGHQAVRRRRNRVRGSLRFSWPAGEVGRGLRFTQEELNDIVLRAHKAGFQVWTHALGDKAQDMILEAYERAETADPRPDPRHRIEHAGNNEAGPTTVEQLERMKRLDVIPVPTGAWIYLGHAAFKTQAKVPFIYRTMLDHGLRPPGTSDSLGSMPESMNPFFSMWAMVTRKTRDGEPNGPEEAISIKEAIHGYTIDGAHSGFEENIKGSLERNKVADLIVVSADPLSIAPDQIKDIRVLMTVINGKIVWQADQ